MTVLSVPSTAVKPDKVPLVVDNGDDRRRRRPELLEAGFVPSDGEEFSYKCFPGFWRVFGGFCVFSLLAIVFVFVMSPHCSTAPHCRRSATAAPFPGNPQQQLTVEDVAPSYDASDDDDDDDNDDASVMNINNNGVVDDNDDDYAAAGSGVFRSGGFTLPLEVSLSSPTDLFNSALLRHLFVPRPFDGQMPKSPVTRSARFIHDYAINVTGVVDVEAKCCYVMPLLRDSLLPPTSLYDLMVKVSSGYYSLDVQKVMDGMRKVEPAVKDLSVYGENVSKECAGYPTYRLEKDVHTTTSTTVSDAAPMVTAAPVSPPS